MHLGAHVVVRVHALRRVGAHVAECNAVVPLRRVRRVECRRSASGWPANTGRRGDSVAVFSLFLPVFNFLYFSGRAHACELARFDAAAHCRARQLPGVLVRPGAERRRHQLNRRLAPSSPALRGPLRKVHRPGQEECTALPAAAYLWIAQQCLSGPTRSKNRFGGGHVTH